MARSGLRTSPASATAKAIRANPATAAAYNIPAPLKGSVNILFLDGSSAARTFDAFMSQNTKPPGSEEYYKSSDPFSKDEGGESLSSVAGVKI